MSFLSKVKSVVKKVASTVSNAVKSLPQPASAIKSTPVKSSLPAPKPLGGLSSSKAVATSGALVNQPQKPSVSGYTSYSQVKSAAKTPATSTKSSSSSGGSASAKLGSSSTPSSFSALNFANEPIAFNTPAPLSSFGGELGAGIGTGAVLGTSAGTTIANQGIYGDYYNNAESDYLKKEKEKDKNLKTLEKLLGQYENKPAEQAQLEIQAGIPQTQAEIRDLQAKQSAETAQYLAQTEAIQNKPIALEFIAGQQGEVQRRYGIDALITSSLLQAKQGQLTTAQDSVDRAISVKYDALEYRIKTQQQILEYNYDDLSRSDKKLADARKEELDKQKADLDRLKDFQTDALNTARDTGAPLSVMQKIARASSIDEILEVGGNYIRQQNLDIRELNGGLVAIDKNTGQIVKSYGGGSTGGYYTGAGSSAGDLLGLAEGLSVAFPQKSQRETFMNRARSLANSGDTAKLKDFIFQGATKALPTGEGAKVYNRYLMLKNLKGLDESLQAYYANGGTTNLLAGTKQQVMKKLGAVGDPNLYSIGQQIANFVDEVARYRTGAALTASEEKFYRNIAPSLFRGKKANQAAVTGLQQSLYTSVNGSLGFALGAGGLDDFLNTEGGIYSGGVSPETPVGTEDDPLGIFQ